MDRVGLSDSWWDTSIYASISTLCFKLNKPFVAVGVGANAGARKQIL